MHVIGDIFDYSEDCSSTLKCTKPEVVTLSGDTLARQGVALDVDVVGVSTCVISTN